MSEKVTSIILQLQSKSIGPTLCCSVVMDIATERGQKTL